MATEIREIVGSEEARTLQRVGRKAFHIGFSLIVPRPKWGFGAWEEGECLGGVFLKQVGEIGVIDFIFISAAARGKGIAKKLTERAIQEFQKRGIKRVAASVRDDNTGSWNLFAGRGFSALSIGRGTRELGLGGMLRLSIATFQMTAFGFDLWLGDTDQALGDSPDQTLTPRDSNPGAAFATFLGHTAINMVLVLGSWIFNVGNPAVFAIAVGILIYTRMLLQWVGARFAFPHPQLRMARGGHIISAIVGITNGFFFYPSYWHPKKSRWREPDYRTGLGASALLGVIGVMAVVGTSSLLRASGTLSAGMATDVAATVGALGKWILIVELQPLFEAWSGPRIVRWNLPVYLLSAAAGLALVIWA